MREMIRVNVVDLSRNVGKIKNRTPQKSVRVEAMMTVLSEIRFVLFIF